MSPMQSTENTGFLFSFAFSIYTVKHKKLHPTYSYNTFAKLCHTMTIFGICMHMRIPNHLPVW